jgi:hypothetical protein
MRTPWTLKELTNLAHLREKGLSYRQIQQEYFPERTTASVRSAAQTDRYRQTAEAVQKRPEVFVAGDTVDRFVFPDINVEMTSDRFAELVRLYVETGGNYTQSKLARKFGLSLVELRHILRQYGLTKDSPPVPRELMAQQSDDEIVESALATRENVIMERVEQGNARYFERKYRALLKTSKPTDVLLARIDEMLLKRASVFGSKHVSIPQVVGQPKCVHVPTADLHIGKYAWAPETGADYDTTLAAERLIEHGQWVAGHLREAGGVDTAYVTDVGDFFHAIMGQTESGTSLDRDTRDLKVFDAAFEAKVQQIDAIREHAHRVEIISVPGNHDHVFASLFQRMLAIHYSNAPEVDVRTPDGRYSGFVYGSTAHILDHGKGVTLSGWKAKAQVRTIAQLLGLDEHPRFVYYVGHLHELEVATHAGMELRRLMPLCEADDYEVSLRYTSSPGAELFWLDEDGRIERIDRFIGEGT